MLANNKSRFRDVFGRPPDWKLRLGRRLFHCWMEEFDGQDFIVSTAEERGTGIEVVSDVSWKVRDEEICRRFVDWLVDQLKQTR